MNHRVPPRTLGAAVGAAAAHGPAASPSPAAGSPRDALRQRLLQLRNAIPDRPAREKALADRVARWLRAVPMRRLAAYWPTRGEADLREVVAAWAAADHARVAALPVINGQQLEFAPWVPHGPMRPGAFGILVPDTAERITPQLLLVACVGIDSRRYRLGYGGGFYDRTLPAMSPRPVVVGVAFDCGRVDSIEPQPHDFRLDLAITESGVW